MKAAVGETKRHSLTATNSTRATDPRDDLRSTAPRGLRGGGFPRPRRRGLPRALRAEPRPRQGLGRAPAAPPGAVEGLRRRRARAPRLLDRRGEGAGRGADRAHLRAVPPHGPPRAGRFRRLPARRRAGARGAAREDHRHADLRRRVAPGLTSGTRRCATRSLALEQRRDGIGLLAPEARGEIEAVLAVLGERKAEETAAREAVAAQLRRHEAIAAATSKTRPRRRGARRGARRLGGAGRGPCAA